MKQKRILVIEDEKNVLEDLKILMEEEGYTVFAESTGKEGISTAREQLPDLIICDIMMREVNGYDVLKAMSKDEKTKSIPFVFLTAKVERQDIRLGMELGADDYLLKPYKADELLNAVEARIKRIGSLKAGMVKETKKNIKRYTYDEKIFTKVNSQPQLIRINEIVYITAENQYTLVSLINGKSFLIRKSVAYWVKVLPQKEFFRAHRSTIINLEYIVKMGKWTNSSLLVYLQNVDKPFIVSKRYSSKFRKSYF